MVLQAVVIGPFSVEATRTIRVVVLAAGLKESLLFYSLFLIP